MAATATAPCTPGSPKAFAPHSPKVHEADEKTQCRDLAKLGTCTAATVDRDGIRLTVVNAYTQFHRRGEGALADYNAIRSAIKLIKRDFKGARIGYPRIGAGLAGGDWSLISRILDEELGDEAHTLVEYQPDVSQA